MKKMLLKLETGEEFEPGELKSKRMVFVSNEN
jgi:hypothetical protein